MERTFHLEKENDVETRKKKDKREKVGLLVVVLLLQHFNDIVSRENGCGNFSKSKGGSNEKEEDDDCEIKQSRF